MRSLDYYKALATDIEGVVTIPYGLWGPACKEAGIYDKQAVWVDQYREGRLSFHDLYKNVAELLKQRLSYERFVALAESVVHNDGASEFFRRAKRRFGKNIALISAGADPLVKYVQALYDIEYAVCNDVSSHYSSDAPLVCRVDRNNKARHFQEFCTKIKINPNEAIAIGDGPEDLSMLEIAGLPIAFNGTNALREIAKSKSGIIVNRNTMLDESFHSIRVFGRDVNLEDLSKHLAW